MPSISKERKEEIIAKYGKTAGDSGSTEVQIALLTAKIEHLSKHLQEHSKDYHSQRGLLQMVGKRKRLQNYLSKKDFEAYKALIKSLGLRR